MKDFDQELMDRMSVWLWMGKKFNSRNDFDCFNKHFKSDYSQYSILLRVTFIKAILAKRKALRGFFKD